MKKIIKPLCLILLFSSSISIANKEYDVIAIGNALVDVIEYAQESRINELGFKKGDTTKLNSFQADKLQQEMENPEFIPGGSAANVMVGFTSLGGKTAFNSIVSNDNLGRLFIKSLKDKNVDYLSKIDFNTNKHTARCFTFITPDKDRTFAVEADLINDLDDSFISYDKIKVSEALYLDSSSLDHGKIRS